MRAGRGLFFQYNDRGDTRVAFITLSGQVTELARSVGGLDIGRPYPGGQYSASTAGRIAFTHTAPDHPADIAVGGAGTPAQRLTRLNDDLFGRKNLAPVEEIWSEGRCPWARGPLRT